MKTLDNKRVAILTDNGFEEVELTAPKKALEDAGAKVDIVSLQKGKVKGWDHDHWSIDLPVDVDLVEAKTEAYDALMIPGGVINPDIMRRHNEYISFAQEFLESGKPVAAICHGPQLLIETGLISGKHITSFPSIRRDIINAGGYWKDEEVVTDNGLVTSRSPEDIPAFNKKMIEEIAEGQHDPEFDSEGSVLHNR
ncbi:type 1 glutamine amidotransferase domain-containing protein [Ferruginibacter albus]|uniref:type 1 glutamine amidotransferase domain-containing protein n=1 Tax=Ferruginibacter albus TaxID=2875540 RepID=UPI001CC68CFE|nr:type 1 glutamine amidotransferase domain-containing protein [Ferruginibacter albus]UAY53319.1 type 1 glutamine amidotransferase [Ferruginibacter albus]